MSCTHQPFCTGTRTYPSGRYCDPILADAAEEQVFDVECPGYCPEHGTCNDPYDEADLPCCYHGSPDGRKGCPKREASGMDDPPGPRRVWVRALGGAAVVAHDVRDIEPESESPITACGMVLGDRDTLTYAAPTRECGNCRRRRGG